MNIESVTSLDLHVFGDASVLANCAAVYAVITQPNSINQGLVTSKSRISKKNLTIPRLELVSAHMSANLVTNVKLAIQNQNVKSVTGWTDSTVVLYWLNQKGNYKQFVGNRVDKIREKDFIKWYYVPTKENPADLGSRGCLLSNIPEVWWKGPAWLTEPENWPDQPYISPTIESEKESKLIKEVLATTTEKTDDYHMTLSKHQLHKTLRVTAWISRFINNCRKIKRTGPLKVEEIQKQLKFYIKREQTKFENSEAFKENQSKLNLCKNQEGIYECRGRIEGKFPVYLPSESVLSDKIIFSAHKSTIHGGVTMTMSQVRSDYWIPTLRNRTKSIIRKCNTCKKFRAVSYPEPKPGLLTKDRTEQCFPFQVIGVDYAGPIYYRSKIKRDLKAYILLFSCSVSRAVYLELTPNLITSEFIRCLKRLIARRGRPKIIYSDNAKTFKAGAKLLHKINKDEKWHTYLSEEQIVWKFNLPRAPWWGGQFERLIVLTKESLYKSIGRSQLTYSELEEILLEVEINMNNRTLTYVEDDIQFNVLTPNSMILGRDVRQIDDTAIDETENWTKRQRYVNRCKENAWKRWRNEYLVALREKHNLNHKNKTKRIEVGDIVMIKGESKNRGNWKIGKISDIYPGKDGIVRAVQIRCGGKFLERPVQLLYPLELHCDVQTRDESKGQGDNKLNANANEFRPRRTAAAIAKLKLHDMIDSNDE